MLEQIFRWHSFASRSLHLFVALLTTQVDSQKTFLVFVVVVIVGFILSLFFAGRWIRSRGTLTATIKKIKGRQIGPVGEQGKEIRLADLAELPAEESAEEGIKK